MKRMSLGFGGAGVSLLGCLLAGLMLRAPVNSAWAEEETKPCRFVIHPMAAPEPALKYQLLPKFLDRLPGNAAVDYGRVTAEQMRFFSNAQLEKKIDQWRSAPLEELRRGQVLNELQESWIYDTLVKAGRREYCDWQFPIREKGHNFYETLLPDVQQSRTYARFLAARARAEVAEGKFDRSIETMQAGFALGQNVAKGPFLVGSLVGIALSELMSQQIEQLVQQRGAPNLYWGLTTLPRPLIDMRQAIEAELNALYLSYPELQDIETADWSLEQWQDFLGRFLTSVDRVFQRKEGPQWQQQLAVTAQALKDYAMAKQYLVEHGYSREAVEAMPVPKVVLLYTMKTFEQFRDLEALPFFVPFPEAQEMANRPSPLVQFLREGKAIVPGPYNTIAAIGSARMAVVRVDREIALLRVVEALRIHAASHAGRLPEKLNDVTEVPVPVDPVTERPFEYQLRGNTAVLQGPRLPGAPFLVEIELAR